MSIKIIFISGLLFSTSILASTKDEIKILRREIEDLKNSYEYRVGILESKLTKKHNGEFNPAIGIILNGTYSNFSKKTSELNGFSISNESSRNDENFSLGESEINFSSNLDDKFYGNLTAAIANENDEDKIEIEESFIETIPGFGLPTGFSIKAGRAFWNIGYLNEHHLHIDDFADRPLPYRVFLDKSFNDDGVQFNYIMPTSFYSEVGGGVFRGDSFPFGGGDGTGSYSIYFRIGDDINQNQNFRIGAYLLSGEAKNGRITNNNKLTFKGDTDLYIADIRYIITPKNSSNDQEIILQAEYFYRDENGSYNDASIASGDVKYNDNISGFYLQSIYKFNSKWRIGVRYSYLQSSDINNNLKNGLLDSKNHNPKSYSSMIDWTNSEFSRIRLQYNREELGSGRDNQIMLQYIASFGAHKYHKY